MARFVDLRRLRAELGEFGAVLCSSAVLGALLDGDSIGACIGVGIVGVALWIASHVQFPQRE